MISRKNRFHGYNALRYIYQKGKVVRSPFVSLKYTPNERRKDYRLAVVVSRKVSKSAVVRNRIRRRLYELVRLRGSDFTGVYDMALVVYDERIADQPAPELAESIDQLLIKAGITPKTTKSTPRTPAGRDIVIDKETEE